jgi:hypothetical protein
VEWVGVMAQPQGPQRSRPLSGAPNSLRTAMCGAVACTSHESLERIARAMCGAVAAVV